ncbi:T6SS immunity protein Tdi1 domain-containing protein [Gilvimarinus japonicus]|uniref:T6SS immunity protein Tdi1 domain-containing protein n=1 Tax=Gilvimarinus japonicus TaxID=1796469 RepID=A0ABV7HNQ4_9GAMM
MNKLLISFLCTFGLLSVAHAYELIEPVATEDNMPCWSNSFPEYTEIIGYSSLGHVFMRSAEQSDYVVLHPFNAAAKSYGVFASVKAFEEKILREESFELFVLRSDHVNEVAEKLGPLQKEEVYIPTPYPFLGGDEAVDSYSKGNIWIMLDIVGQFHDVCT